MNGGFRRREFIGGALSAGAFAGARAFAAPHGKFLGGKPECVFGVVSDIHVNHVGADEKRSGWSNNLTFRHALEWFRENSADAVVLAGDMTNRGTMDELAAVAEAWYRVFPGDRAPDGRKVEKVFVMGNHDFHGYLYGNFAEKVYPDMAERRRHVLRADFPGFWKKFFNEDYSRLFRKTVKGYLFIGEHWDDGIGMEGGRGEYAKTAGSGLEGFLKKNGEKIDRSKPFFYVQHPHLKGTCYGDWSCGTDSGVATRALSAYPNAVAISGHSHYSITDERSIWQGAFTSVGAGSLRYTCLPYKTHPLYGYENSTTANRRSKALDSQKTMPLYGHVADCRQGMLWRVYDDRIVIERREFLSDMSLGEDWVIPLRPLGEKPYSFASRSRKSSPPEFPAAAGLDVRETRLKTRETPGRPSAEKAALEFSFPAAMAVKKSRVFEYEITAVGKNGAKSAFNVIAEGFNHPPASTLANGGVVCSVPTDRLPSGLESVEVRPLNCWGGKGRPLVKRF